MANISDTYGEICFPNDKSLIKPIQNWVNHFKDHVSSDAWGINELILCTTDPYIIKFNGNGRWQMTEALMNQNLNTKSAIDLINALNAGFAEVEFYDYECGSEFISQTEGVLKVKNKQLTFIQTDQIQLEYSDKQKIELEFEDGEFADSDIVNNQLKAAGLSSNQIKTFNHYVRTNPELNGMICDFRVDDFLSELENDPANFKEALAMTDISE